MGLEEIGRGKAIGEKSLQHEIVADWVWGLETQVAPARSGSSGVDPEMVLEVMKKLVSYTTTTTAIVGGGGGSRRINGENLSSFTPIHDLQATHCGKYIVLHLQSTIISSFPNHPRNGKLYNRTKRK